MLVEGRELQEEEKLGEKKGGELAVVSNCVQRILLNKCKYLYTVYMLCFWSAYPDNFQVLRSRVFFKRRKIVIHS